MRILLWLAVITAGAIAFVPPVSRSPLPAIKSMGARRYPMCWSSPAKVESDTGDVVVEVEVDVDDRAATIARIKALESNILSLERLLASTPRNSVPGIPLRWSVIGNATAVVPGFNGANGADVVAGANATSAFITAEKSSDAGSPAALVRGPGLYQSPTGGLYIYLWDLSEHVAGAGVAGGLTAMTLARFMAPEQWLLFSILGAYAAAVAAGTPTALGRFMTQKVGRKCEQGMRGVADRVDELRFYYRTGQVSYRWTKVYSERIQPRLSEWNMEDRLQSVVRATMATARGAKRGAKRVERRYQIGTTIRTRAVQLSEALRTFWRDNAPAIAKRAMTSTIDFGVTCRDRVLRVFESRIQRRDRRLKEYRVGFLGQRNWRSFSD